MSLGDAALPLVVGAILVAGLYKEVPIFESFLAGAGQALGTAASILPALVGLTTAVAVMSSSGALDIFCAALSGASERFGIPPELLPLALLRPVSGSGALVVFEDILRRFGAESLPGLTAAVLLGSTETTFYTIALYYGSIGVGKTRHTLPAAALGDLAGLLFAAFWTRRLLL